MPVCSVPGCPYKHNAHGLCGRHYQALRRQRLLSEEPKRLCDVPECGARHDCHGFCKRHARAFLRHGDPTKFVHHITSRLGTEERFWLQVSKDEGCWLWEGHCSSDGYGSFRVKGRETLTHRFSYLLHKGPIPKGMLVLHSCDRPACVNPAHLFVGTQKDNMQDMLAKGRATRPSGPLHWRSRRKAGQ